MPAATPRAITRLAALALAAVLAACGDAPKLHRDAGVFPLPAADRTPLPRAAPARSAAAVAVPPVRRAAPAAGAAHDAAPRADFGRWRASAAARRVADWAVRGNDHRGEPFMIVDKPNARLLVFDGRGRAIGTAPVLLGLARGDDSAPGIGDKPLEQISEVERTTPAGRFVAERGRNLKGDDILWIDYDAAVSMHRVRSVAAGERRLERLRSPTPRDNRISYGCINVPVAFFDRVIERALGARRTIVVYVLPDSKPLDAVFALGRGGAPAGSPPRAAPARRG